MFRVYDQPRLGTFIDLLTSEMEINDYQEYENLRILVAYAKASGVNRIKPALQKFMGQGGRVKAVVGLGQKNTSYQALKSLLDLGVDVYVFHNEKYYITYHPKVYFLEKEGRAWVSVGSNNLTSGGLISNYETNAYANLDVSSSRVDAAALQEVKDTFSHYSNTSTGLGKHLTEELLEELRTKNYLLDENEARARLRSESKAVEDRIDKIFRSAPPEEPRSEKITSQPIISTATRFTSVLAKGFYKRLGTNDVSLTSSPGQIVIPIGFLPYFPALGDPEFKPSGGTQSDTFFDIVFVEPSGAKKIIKNTRIILYEPAPDHPRQNKESRYTFRDHSILQSLGIGDYLEFKVTDNPKLPFEVRHLKADVASEIYSKRYDTFD